MKKTILTFFIFALSFSMFIENSYGQAKIEFRQIYRDEFVILNIDSLFLQRTREWTPPVRVRPDKSAVIDTKKRTHIQQMVEEINTMQLRSDTLTNTYSTFTRGFFDKENRLRKFLRITLLESEEFRVFAYYDEKGNLVYFAIDSENNHDSRSEYFYIHNGRIVDFMGAYACFSCECDEYVSEWEKYVIFRPVVGDVLTKSITWRWSLTDYLDAQTLLSIVRCENYRGQLYRWKEIMSWE